MTKIEHGYSVAPHAHVEPGERQLEAPLLRLDLAREIAELRGGEALRARGHSAKTLAKYPDLRVVLLAFERGARIEEHQTKGRLSLHLLEGRIALRLAAQEVELSAGCLLEIAPGLPHDVEALEPSSLLLTIAWPVRAATEAEPGGEAP
jgi:quercetin dioxygenase-like cupin family protein